jgi:tRNA_anti-like
MGVVMERWCPTQQMLGVFLKEVSMTKLLLTGVAVLALASSAANAADLGPEDIQRAISTYKQNEARFNRDFAGKSISFSWSLDKVSKGIIGGEYYVTLGNDTVKCDLKDPETLSKAMEWNPGQKLSVEGTVEDVWFGTLHLKGCKLTPKI